MNHDINICCYAFSSRSACRSVYIRVSIFVIRFDSVFGLGFNVAVVFFLFARFSRRKSRVCHSFGIFQSVRVSVWENDSNNVYIILTLFIRLSGELSYII